MCESFSVGEIAIVCGYFDWPELVGSEVEIIGPLSTYRCCKRNTSILIERHGYMVRRPDGVLAIYVPEHLRKRRPPPTREPVSTWDDVIVWKPREVSHV